MKPELICRPNPTLIQNLENLLGVPFTGGNHISVLKNGVEIFPAMLQAINEAESSIEFLTFVYWRGAIADCFASTLQMKAKAGIRVKVLLDAYGARSMDSRLVESMTAAGVEVSWFRPLTWRWWKNMRRTHRKVLVCDNRVGFTGGVGIAKEWEGDARNQSEWRDTHFRIEGPAVDGLRAAFVGNWIEGGRLWDASNESMPLRCSGKSWIQVVRTTSSYGYTDIASLQRAAVLMAQKTLRITTAYFVPDETMVTLLRDTAARGVDVQILTPSAQCADSRVAKAIGDSTIAPLLSAGVKLWRYGPTMMHAKVITIDNVMAIIGSANFNQRSMRQDDEISLAVVDHKILNQLRHHFEKDIAKSELITRQSWHRRSTGRRIMEFVGRGLRAHA